jgi:hypothetical protein
MVTAPCRRFRKAAWWKGNAPHAATGVVSRSDSHCQRGNCSAGTIAMAITWMASTALPTNLWRSVRISSLSGRAASSWVDSFWVDSFWVSSAV